MNVFDPVYYALLDTELSLPALRAARVPEGPLAVMRQQRYLALLRQRGITPQRDTAEWLIRARLNSAAQSARRTLLRNPSLADCYAKRQHVRDFGGDPDTIPLPRLTKAKRLQPELPAAPVVDPWEEVKRLAARPLHNVAGHRYGERGADVRMERKALHDENFETLQARKQLKQHERELARKARLGVGKAELSAVRRTERVAARAELERLHSWAEQALQDQRAIAVQGRQTPVAARHLLGHVPLHLRTARFPHNR